MAARRHLHLTTFLCTSLWLGCGEPPVPLPLESAAEETGGSPTDTSGDETNKTAPPVDTPDYVYAPAGTDIFDTKYLHRVEVALDEKDWHKLRNQGRDISDLAEGCNDGPSERIYDYFEASAVLNGKEVLNIGVRKKGFLGSLLYTRPSLKLKFDAFESDQRYQKNKRVTLNNNRQDAGHMGQCLAYKVFRDAGVPAPRCTFAEVIVNGENLGVYTHVEGVKKPFLAQHFNSDEGNLYEGQLSDLTESLSATFQRKTNALPPTESEQGDETWVDTSTEIGELVTALQVSDDQLLKVLEKHFDLDAFYRFWATEVLIGHSDGYAGNRNNFYLYRNPADDRFVFLPWGADMVFQTTDPFGEGSTNVSVKASGALANRLFNHPQGRQRYFEELTSLLDVAWNEQALLDEIDRLDKVTGYTASETVLAEFREYIETRRELITAEIEKNAFSDWPSPPASVCMITGPKVEGRFRAAWMTSFEGPQPRQLENSLILHSDPPVEPNLVLSTANTQDSIVGQDPTIQLLGILDEGNITLLQTTIERGQFYSNNKIRFQGFATFGVYLEGSGDTQNEGELPETFGFVSNGTVSLDDVSTTEGELVSGSVSATVYWSQPDSALGRKLRSQSAASRNR